MKRLTPALLCLLAACGTPQEQCIAQNTRDLRTVEKLIAEAETNLKRGYALEKETIRFAAFERCLIPGRPTPENPNPAPVVSTCPTTREQTVTKPVAIDLEAEARKLAQLKDKRVQLSRAAEPVIAQCQALYPE